MFKDSALIERLFARIEEFARKLCASQDKTVSHIEMRIEPENDWTKIYGRYSCAIYSTQVMSDQESVLCQGDHKRTMEAAMLSLIRQAEKDWDDLNEPY